MLLWHFVVYDKLSDSLRMKRTCVVHNIYNNVSMENYGKLANSRKLNLLF